MARNIEQDNAMFLVHSMTRQAPMNTPDGTAFSEGKKLRFTAPIVPGWARFIRVYFDMTVAVVVGAGTAAVSAAAPYNILQNLKVLFGGTELRNHHPYVLKLMKQTDEHDGGFWTYGGPVTQSYASTIFTTPAVADGNNTWKGFFDIPLQMAESAVMGLLPMGASASPVTLELDCASSVDGTDALLNPVYVTGGATATATGTISATVYYAYGQSPHDPRVRVPTPVVGSFAKVTQQETPITVTTGITYADLREPYPLLKAFQVAVIPSQASFCTFANLVGARFDLDSGTPYLNYESTGATVNSLWYDQRNRYGQDLDVGVIAWDFISGSDPKHPDGMNSVNIELYNAARCGLQYNGALAANSNRILTAAMFVTPLPF